MANEGKPPLAKATKLKKSVSFAEDAKAPAADTSAESSKAAIRQEAQERLKILQKKKRRDAAIFKLQASLIERHIDEAHLKHCLIYFKPETYQTVVEERALGKICGFPLCSKDLPDYSKAPRFKISYKDKEIYEREKLQNFCGIACMKRSNIIFNSLPILKDIPDKVDLSSPPPIPIIKEHIQPAPVSELFPVSGSAVDAYTIEGFKAPIESEAKDALSSSIASAKTSTSNGASKQTEIETETSKSEKSKHTKDQKTDCAGAPEKESSKTEPSDISNEARKCDEPFTPETWQRQENVEAEICFAESKYVRSLVLGDPLINQDITSGVVEPDINPFDNLDEIKEFNEMKMQRDSCTVEDILQSREEIAQDIAQFRFSPFLKLWTAFSGFVDTPIDDRENIPRLISFEIDEFHARRLSLRSYIIKPISAILQEIGVISGRFSKPLLTELVLESAKDFKIDQPVPSLSTNEWKVFTTLLVICGISTGENIDIMQNEEVSIGLMDYCFKLCRNIGISKEEFDVLLAKLKKHDYLRAPES